MASNGKARRKAGRFNAIQLYETLHLVHAGILNGEIRHHSGWTREPWPQPGIVRRQSVFLNSWEVASDCFSEECSAGGINAIVQRVAVFDIGPEFDLSRKIHCCVYSEPALFLFGHRIDEMREGRWRGIAKIIALADLQRRYSGLIQSLHARCKCAGVETCSIHHA